MPSPIWKSHPYGRNLIKPHLSGNGNLLPHPVKYLRYRKRDLTGRRLTVLQWTPEQPSILGQPQDFSHQRVQAVVLHIQRA
ncbi:hypothetical protein NPIL_683501 [Nephila pilipes]|uniref:Uncharacterized protein n=1 Tax=Nephila pilipes TaxID=299642 RepID=A0A8X6TIB2_NEPPI|nr:hypothetical protein NPIL_683501 [Nephila pilipes]